MKYLLIGLIFIAMAPVNAHHQETPETAKPNFAIAIHGGAGTISRKNMSEEMEKEYRKTLEEVTNAGYEVLKKGGSALDAVETSIRIMEDSPLFNAGRGAVFTNAGKNELDASIMDGSDRNAGAVAGVTTVRHPISAARKVLAKSPHVMMSGPGAETFAKDQGCEIVKPEFFRVENRWKQLERARKKEQIKLDHSEDEGAVPWHKSVDKFGTVGVVALDQNGNLAAGTSTGGMTNKRWGRIGDSPVIGAGTYANNATCAVSCTGHGEYFIRWAAAYDVSAIMEYKGVSLKEAAEEVIQKKLKPAGGDGGLIAIDKQGNIAMPFNTRGMYRASRKKGEKKATVKIYKEK